MTTAINTSVIAAATPPRVYTKLHVANFEEPTISALIRAKGKGAALYEDACLVCKNNFVVRAFTWLSQMKRYGQFKPPEYCRGCFDQARGVSSPTPPGNAVLRKQREESIPTNLDDKTLSIFRRKWEGKEVLLRFKQAVSFSDQDESGQPDSGRCLTVSRTTITIVDDGAAAHEARTFALSDIAEVKYLSKHIAEVANAAAAEALSKGGDLRVADTKAAQEQQEQYTDASPTEASAVPQIAVA